MQRPILHALFAVLYILGIVLFIDFLDGAFPKEDNLLMPVAALSMATLSVSLMAYLFFGEPLRLAFDGKAKEGVRFFAMTVGAMAVCVVVIFTILLIFS